jgi:type I restriction enzyme M protein
MDTAKLQEKESQELQTALWDMANSLRGNMDANEFKNYILGLIFYKNLCDKEEKEAATMLKDDDISFAEAWEIEDYREGANGLKDQLSKKIGYCIEPKYLFSSMIPMVKNKTFSIDVLEKGINSFNSSVQAAPIGEGLDEEERKKEEIKRESCFDGLFDDLDLHSNKLGKGENEKSELIGKVLMRINDIELDAGETQIDLLGDSYEYLIGKFAASAGKKAGEFYTPQQVSKLLAKLVTKAQGKTNLKNVYDPACGSGSLLLRIGAEANVRSYYGQELNNTTYNLARMNMLLHNLSYKQFNIYNGDTLENPCSEHMDIARKEGFDAVVANPPYSAQWSADPKFLEDERFSGYGKLAPRSKADYAFVLHMIYSLSESGTCAVVLPHGVLFRGAAEEVIRTTLIKDRNYLDAVIGLPANLFYGTSIPTCVLVFKKCRKQGDNILFIDASKEFESGKNQNRLTDENVEKIVQTYMEREDVHKYAHCASMKEIEDNGYNLNIPRYVDTFEEEKPIDIQAVMKDLKALEKQRKELDKEISVYLKELGIDYGDDE